MDPAEFRADKERRYNIMKKQWQSVLPEQIERNSALREMFNWCAKRYEHGAPYFAI
jgi:hypothetical protein